MAHSHNDYAAYIRDELAVKHGITLADLIEQRPWLSATPDELIYDAASKLVALDLAKRELIGSTVSLIAILLGGKPFKTTEADKSSRIRP